MRNLTSAKPLLLLKFFMIPVFLLILPQVFYSGLILFRNLTNMVGIPLFHLLSKVDNPTPNAA